MVDIPGTDTQAPSDDLRVRRPNPPAARQVGMDAPLRWLALGWQDMRATRFRGVYYGLTFVLMGFAVSAIYATRWQLTMGLVAGFFLMGPFICTGIYELSRQRERGERIDLAASMFCWTRNPGAIAFFAAILTFAMIVWARVSVVLFALFASAEFPTLKGVLAHIFSLENPEFLFVWLGAGFVFASIVFAISVVSVPLLLDRNTDTMMAIFASVRALFVNAGPLYLWAFLIVAIIGASLLSGFLPLLLTAPLIGHATWHAYRDLLQRDEGA